MCFNWSIWLDVFKYESFGIVYFRKSVYGDWLFVFFGVFVFIVEDFEVCEYLVEYFWLIVVVREDVL